MSNPTIEQMNVAIARFENRKFFGKYTIDDYGPNHGLKYPEMKYYSSWDWLMPVVEEIESIYHDFHGYFAAHISSNSCTIQGTKLRTGPERFHPAYFAEFTLNTKIESTHYAVYQFIQWYNKQKEATP